MAVKVIVAKNSGFCGGVSRAFNLVNQLVEQGKVPVQTYGELVHNPDVISLLESKGVGVAHSIDEVIRDAHVVVRAHGVPDSEMQRLKEKTSGVYDGKCPIVGIVQSGVRAKVEDGYFAVVWGKAGHPEMVCLTADLPARSYAVIDDSGEVVECLKNNHHPRMYLCSQTTKDPVGFNSMAEELTAFFYGSGTAFEADNTACKPTGNAKRFAEAVARESDCMVIIGGNNSSNTLGLVSVCKSVYAGSGKKVILVENGTGLGQYLKGGPFTGVKKVGVAAGTSTPPWVIDDVCNRLKAYN